MTARRSAQCLVAVAAVALATSSCAGSTSTRAPATKTTPTYAPPPASYYAPGVPYVLNGTLYINHTAQPGNWIEAQTVGAYTAAIGSDPKRGDFSLVLMRHGVTIQIEHGYSLLSAEFSPNGTKLVWFKTDRHDVATLVSQDLSQSRELGRISIPVKPLPDSGVGVSLQIENDGTVHYDLQDTSWSWKPGLAPVRAQMPNALSVHPAGFQGVRAPVSLSPDHLWGAWENNAKDRLIVQKPGDPTSRFSIKLPPGSRGPSPVLWQSPTVATIDVDGFTSDGLRKQVQCDIVFQVCEEVNQP